MLKRLYLDRIISSKAALGDQSLVCGKCKTLIGVQIIYKKENRPALRIFPGAIEKRIIKDNKLPIWNNKIDRGQV